MEWLEKNEPSTVPHGYSLSVAYHSLLDITHSIYAVIEEQSSPTFRKNHEKYDAEKHKGWGIKASLHNRHLPLELSTRLFSLTYPHLLEGLNVLLESRLVVC